MSSHGCALEKLEYCGTEPYDERTYCMSVIKETEKMKQWQLLKMTFPVFFVLPVHYLTKVFTVHLESFGS